MKVHELISHLQKVDQNAEAIVIVSEEFQWSSWTSDCQDVEKSIVDVVDLETKVHITTKE